MFKVDMDAIREAAIETWLTANPANPANPANRTDLIGARNPGAPPARQMFSQVATLAITQSEERPTDPVVVALLEAAMRACDYWGDSPTARAQMVVDIGGTPQHHHQELLEHFLIAYGQAK
jgi:hypothetical protein